MARRRRGLVSREAGPSKTIAPEVEDPICAVGRTTKVTGLMACAEDNVAYYMSHNVTQYSIQKVFQVFTMQGMYDCKGGEKRHTSQSTICDSHFDIFCSAMCDRQHICISSQVR